MGRAARWLRGLLGGGKKAGSVAPPPAKEKKRWTFSRASNEDRRGPCGEGSRASPAAALDAPPPVSDGDEQNKHAIAVAAATAAVAEAAVAAAQAAAVVVRLTSSGRSASAQFGSRGTKTEEFAAVKIQSAFRGYLARRALRALKGLVKLQALVRGNIVRKQATETLRCMQALVRVQARARARRALCPENARRKRSSSPHPQGPPTPEKYEAAIRGKGLKSDRLHTLKKDFSRPVNVEPFEQDSEISSGWNWLDRWMEERYSESRVSAKSMMGSGFDEDKTAKVLEVDSGKPRYNAKRSSNYYYSCSTLASDPNSHSFATVQDSPSKDSTIAQLSIPSPSSVDMQQSLSPQRFVMEAVELAESPHFYSASSSRPGTSRRGPFTPSKSECSRSLFSGYPDYPNYMANTQSSRAKTRSQSAPKQRPEFEKLGSLKRSSHHHGYGHQPGSSVVTQKSSSLHAKFANKAYPGSGRLDRLGMPLRT